MGWRLAEEVAWARPEEPGPEWWTLLDLAQDANDETRQGWPGREYLMARGKCSRATVFRRLRALAEAGHIKTARRPAPGRRAVYEILILHRGPVDNPATCVTNAETRNGSHDEGQRVSQTAERVSLTPNSVTSQNATTPQVTEPRPVTPPPSIHPSLSPVIEIGVLTSPVPVEGARARSGQDRFISDEEWERRERVAARTLGPLPEARP